MKNNLQHMNRTLVQFMSCGDWPLLLSSMVQARNRVPNSAWDFAWRTTILPVLRGLRDIALGGLHSLSALAQFFSLSGGAARHLLAVVSGLLRLLRTLVSHPVATGLGVGGIVVAAVFLASLLGRMNRWTRTAVRVVEARDDQYDNAIIAPVRLPIVDGGVPVSIPRPVRAVVGVVESLGLLDTTWFEVRDVVIIRSVVFADDFLENTRRPGEQGQFMNALHLAAPAPVPAPQPVVAAPAPRVVVQHRGAPAPAAAPAAPAPAAAVALPAAGAAPLGHEPVLDCRVVGCTYVPPDRTPLICRGTYVCFWGHMEIMWCPSLLEGLRMRFPSRNTTLGAAHVWYLQNCPRFLIPESTACAVWEGTMLLYRSSQRLRKDFLDGVLNE